MSAAERVAEFLAAHHETSALDLIAHREYHDGMGMGIAVLNRSDVQALSVAAARTPLPAVDDLALMLAAADRLWCEDTGDEQGSPEFWRAIASRLDSIARRQHAERSP